VTAEGKICGERVCAWSLSFFCKKKRHGEQSHRLFLVFSHTTLWSLFGFLILSLWAPQQYILYTVQGLCALGGMLWHSLNRQFAHVPTHFGGGLVCIAALSQSLKCHHFRAKEDNHRSGDEYTREIYLFFYSQREQSWREANKNPTPICPYNGVERVVKSLILFFGSIFIHP